MRILLTNDDGIEAEGLHLLADWAKRYGDVTVAAPRRQQSAKGHSVELHEPVEIKPYDFGNGMEAYTVDSTPADCVRFGILTLEKNFDLVLSGINAGYNFGSNTLYSATVGASLEALILGCRTLALSADSASFDGASQKNLDAVWNFLHENALFDRCGFYNINFPCAPRGIRVTRQGGEHMRDRFVPVGNDLYRASGFCLYRDTENMELDTDAVTHGFISVTPLSADWTDAGAFRALSGLSASL